MEARRIGDVLDFLAEPIWNPIETNFKRLDDGLLLGKKLAPLLAFLSAFLSALLP